MTTVTTRAAARSTSSAVVVRPNPKRTEAPARSPTAPIACSTCDGFWLPELQANFPIDVVRDFVPIGFVGGHPMVVAASADLGVGTLPELIALAKKPATAAASCTSPANGCAAPPALT